MPYAIDGAISQDPLEGGVEISVEQYGAALAGMVDGLLVRVTGGEMAVVAPPTPEPYVAPPPGPYRLYKSTFVRRFSSAEAAAMEILLNGEDPWLRMLYHSVEYFMSDDALFTYLHFVLKESLGLEKVDALLAPEGA